MPTNRDKIIKTIQLILKKNQVAKADLFGSFARGEKKVNDIDVIIEFKGKKSLFDLIDLQQQLEKALHKKIDIITYQFINSNLKKYISKDMVRIL